MFTIVIGTNRPGSNSAKIAGHIAGIYKSLGEPYRLLDLADLPAEIFSPASYTTKPASFAPFTQAILDSTGLIIVTPEYNGGIPGILKYFIDMLKFPESFEKRPVCFVGLSFGQWGALRPIEQLQQIFGYRNAYSFPERVFIPGVANVLSPEGTITSDDLNQRLQKQAKGFIEFAKKLHSPAAS